MLSPLAGNSLSVAENSQKPEEKVHDEMSEQELPKEKRNTKEESNMTAFQPMFDPPEPSAHHTSQQRRIQPPRKAEKRRTSSEQCSTTKLRQKRRRTKELRRQEGLWSWRPEPRRLLKWHW
ncbi:hypothetical protein KIN20_009896 [Parelaphostrongylus tenuis]|uniref:Uncharacterized protein n=1 Tax=Parelaphostrongylus tenuis TaxID=148309 RepID=A0AAD5M729_PARTN|nr:hypothetical protein KIN20_009896 [Parelaphostrongylus tenuis]